MRRIAPAAILADYRTRSGRAEEVPTRKGVGSRIHPEKRKKSGRHIRVTRRQGQPAYLTGLGRESCEVLCITSRSR